MVDTELKLYEEVLLLALKDKEGTFDWHAGNYSYAMAGGIMAELILGGKIRAEATKKAYINVMVPDYTGEEILDVYLERMYQAKRRKKLRDWVATIGNRTGLKHEVARSLCRKGILQLEEHRVLSLFRTRRYPELIHEPEQKILDRLKTAIFTDQPDIDARTAILISLTNSAGMLGASFPRKELKARKKRIHSIVEGECIGNATKEAIEAVQAAIVVAAIIPALVATTAATS